MRIPIMSEKAPLIPVAGPAERFPHVNRCYRGRSIGKVITAVAAAGIIYYGVPYGMFDVEKSACTILKQFSWQKHGCE
jgi:hypothetical protein